MKVIQVTDEDCRGLLDQLELNKYHPPQLGVEVPAGVLEEAHRHFHYVVCSWLQKHGADVVRR
ncbi:MAG: hypothetical protein O7A04_06805 [Acidobacteria bacterium]|nr:hypothetical protein [Acidobacteriota bacterium]